FESFEQYCEFMSLLQQRYCDLLGDSGLKHAQTHVESMQLCVTPMELLENLDGRPDERDGLFVVIQFYKSYNRAMKNDLPSPSSFGRERACSTTSSSSYSSELSFDLTAHGFERRDEVSVASSSLSTELSSNISSSPFQLDNFVNIPSSSSSSPMQPQESSLPGMLQNFLFRPIGGNKKSEDEILKSTLEMMPNNDLQERMKSLIVPILHDESLGMLWVPKGTGSLGSFWRSAKDREQACERALIFFDVVKAPSIHSKV
ncbi:MAG: hypothetical protein WCT20_05595, partial [Candidatus Babeliales bacterium]